MVSDFMTIPAVKGNKKSSRLTFEIEEQKG